MRCCGYVSRQQLVTQALVVDGRGDAVRRGLTVGYMGGDKHMASDAVGKG